MTARERARARARLKRERSLLLEALEALRVAGCGFALCRGPGSLIGGATCRRCWALGRARRMGIGPEATR